MTFIFSIISDFFSSIADAFTAIDIATSYKDIPFKVAYLLARHVRNGHPFSTEHEIVDTLRSEKHPHTNEINIYTVHLVQCKCGLIYQSCGLESRVKWWKE
jgi:hypothetical protein